MVRGVVIPAGRHIVEMRYLPEGWAESVPVTRGAFAAVGLLTLSLGIAELRRRRTPAWSSSRYAASSSRWRTSMLSR